MDISDWLDKILSEPVVIARLWISDCRREWREEYRYTLKKESWLLNATIWLFFILYCFTPREILQANVKKFRGEYWWWRNRYKFVEVYVAFWLIIDGSSIGLLGVMPYLSSNGWFITILIFLLWRLLDIFQSWVNINILSANPSPYSVPRMFILDLISFVEVAIIFGVLAFFVKSAFSVQPSIETVWQSLYYSVATITTIGSNYTPVDWRGYLLFYGEIAFGILFLVVVIQRVLSLFPRR